MERLHILDGYGYIFRAFYGLAGGSGGRGVRLTNSAGMPTGALYVYARMLVRLHKDVHPERIAVVFDAPGRTFRDDLDSEYKATRRETPEDLKVQMPYFRPLTEAFCWPVLSVEGVEADDVIATLARAARKRDWDVVIHTGDKDLMQLVDDHVTVVDSLRQATYDSAKVAEKFGVPPAQVADWLALVGDTSDNVPGVTGVGKKTAASLLERFGSIEGILGNTAKLKGKQKERFSDADQLERLALSRKLVALKDDVEVGVALEELKPRPWDGERLRKLLEELEFQALVASLEPGTIDADAAENAGHAEIATEAVDSVARLDEIAQAARESGELALYVETDGARPDRARVVGLAVATDERAAAYVPIAHRYLSAPTQLPADQVAGWLRPLLADAGIDVVCHDTKAARRVLKRMGVELSGAAFDTMLAAYLIDIDPAVERVLLAVAGRDIPPRKALLGRGKSAIEFEAVAVPDAAAYCGRISAGLLAARRSLEKRLAAAEQADLLRDLEQPLALLLADLEDAGITLDVAHLSALSDQVGGQIAEIERRVFAIAGEEINLGSPKQLAALLFDKLGLRSGKMKKTKTGYSTDHEVLESLRDAHEIVAPILEHRELIKLKGTYIDALPPLVNPATGRLHTSFNQAVAATGRLSSQDPNLQNIPIRTELGREIRRAFVAADGMTLLSADYSQIELRILAHLSEDPRLLEAFKNRVDIHTQTAAEVFGIPMDEVGAHERRVAKAVNYGLAYGQSDFGLARALDLPRREAKHYIDTYFARFARVREFMEELVESARESGYATTILGRRRPIPDLGAKNHQRRQAAQRIAQNTPIQGSGADILKLAMLKVQERLEGAGLDARMLLTVHDELVFEVAGDQADALGGLVKQVMESTCELRVPLVVDIGCAPSWADAH